MKASPFLLLLLPLFMRMYLKPPDVLNVTLSLVPFLFLIIASYGPSIWKDEEVEHLARHIIFTAVFAMSAGVSIDWAYVMQEIDNINVARIILFVLVAGGTQLWFCIAHILENSGSSFVRTHQGDAAVLPSSLIILSIVHATFPLGVFRYMQSLLYLIPVLVGWCTIFFLTHTNFGNLRVTTYTSNGYTSASLQGFLLATTHLCILETRAPIEIFIFAPFITSIICQTSYPATDPDVSVKDKSMMNVILQTVAAIFFGSLAGLIFVLYYNIQSPATIVAILSGCILLNDISVSLGRELMGNRWPVPFSLWVTYITLIMVAALDVKIHIIDILLLEGVFLVDFLLVMIVTYSLNTSELEECTPPHPPSYDPIQKNTFVDWVVKIERVLTEPIERCLPGRRYTAKNRNWMYGFFKVVDKNCPPRFQGVWWMKDNTLPMHLISVQHCPWIHGVEATLLNFENTSRSRTLLALCSHVISKFSTTHMRIIDANWVSTDITISLFGKTLLKNRLWIYTDPDKPDQMRRLQYNSKGEITYDYQLCRIAYSLPNKKIHETVFMEEFLEKYKGRTFFAYHPKREGKVVS